MKSTKSTLLFLVFVAVFLITIINIPTSFSQTSDNPQLFTPIAIGASSNVQIPTSPMITQSQIVSVDIDALNAEQVDVALFGNTVTISKDRITTNEDYYAWFGSGDNINAVIIVDEMELAGLISTNHGTYSILATDLESVHILLDIDTSQFPPEYGYAANENKYDELSGTSGHNTIQQSLITQLEDAYVGGRDYSDDKVTIDVYVAYTSNVDNSDEHRNPGSATRLAVELANDSYNDNHLPLKLNFVDSGVVRGYTETSISDSLHDITDTSNRDFNRVRADAANNDADVIVFFVNDDFKILKQTYDIDAKAVNRNIHATVHDVLDMSEPRFNISGIF